jgi:hypothetical protein
MRDRARRWGWRLPDRTTVIEVVIAAVLVVLFFYGVLVAIALLTFPASHS